MNLVVTMELVGFAWETADLRKRHRIDQERYDEEPRFTVHDEQDPPAKHKTNQQIGNNRQKEFHACSLARSRAGASLVLGNMIRTIDYEHEDETEIHRGGLRACCSFTHRRRGGSAV